MNINHIKRKLVTIHDLFRYDIPRFTKNLYVFRKTLWNSRSYDYSGVYYALTDQLSQMEPVIRNGNHVRGVDVADKIKVCLVLLDRINNGSDQDHFDDVDVKFTPSPRYKKCSTVTLTYTPKHPEAPRNSEYQYKITKSKEEVAYQLLMKILTKHLRNMWE